MEADGAPADVLDRYQKVIMAREAAYAEASTRDASGNHRRRQLATDGPDDCNAPVHLSTRQPRRRDPARRSADASQPPRRETGRERPTGSPARARCVSRRHRRSGLRFHHSQSPRHSISTARTRKCRDCKPRSRQPRRTRSRRRFRSTAGSRRICIRFRSPFTVRPQLASTGWMARCSFASSAIFRSKASPISMPRVTTESLGECRQPRDFPNEMKDDLLKLAGIDDIAGFYRDRFYTGGVLEAQLLRRDLSFRHQFRAHDVGLRQRASRIVGARSRLRRRAAGVTQTQRRLSRGCRSFA